MTKYDSFLYGNGLTLNVLSIAKKESTSPLTKYLNCDDFFNDFLIAKSHSKILRTFLKYFTIDKQIAKKHDETRKFLKDHYIEISKLGFERWVSKYLFNKEIYNKGFNTYLYILYNYWFHLINKEILNNDKICQLRNKISAFIIRSIVNNERIFTTNFDNLLDKTLINPKHLHGCFVLPLDNIKELILFFYNENEFEFKYLFGGNGLEKIYRINKINKIKQNIYSLDFFYNENLHLGNLLIYGLALGKSEIMSDEFLTRFPQHNNRKLVRSVDGHILLRLIIMYKRKKINKMTFAYYTKEDLRNYRSLFDDTILNRIIEYKQSSEIFDFNKNF